MRLDSLQVHFPAEMLAVHFPNICDEESILLSGLTNIRVDTIHPLVQSGFYELCLDFRAIAVNLGDT